MDITEIRQNISVNISAMRNAAGLTQAQFAEKLNYTDKAISKWERGESVPDIAVLWQIADMFGVTVDWLISDHGESESTPDAEAVRAGQRNRLLISLLSSVGVWFIATIVFIVMQSLGAEHVWMPFMWAVPATCIDLLVFNAIWGKYKLNFLFISLIIWTIIGATYITIANWSLWYIFLFGAPLQVATIFWSQIKIIINPKKKTENTAENAE
jgi:transcriptional regulator with XRE-family HTH domain